MKTIFITGHDTEIGKTKIAQYIATTLSHRQEPVQIIKPVETGVNYSKEPGAITTILQTTNPKFTTGFTLNSFTPPLAPLTAAKIENKQLSINKLIQQINTLPTPTWRIIETAGGLAVPLDPSGADGRDLATQLHVDFIILVIHNRLGAINQARLLDAYTPKHFAQVGFWLNDLSPPPPNITESFLDALQTLPTPLWAHTGYQQTQPYFCNAPFLSLTPTPSCKIT